MLKRLVLICAVSFILTACFGGKPFQPPPEEYTQWIKGGVSEEGVKQAMRQCGFTDLYGYGGDRNATFDDIARRENCMFQNGFKRKSGYKGICSLRRAKDIQACQELQPGD